VASNSRWKPPLYDYPRLGAVLTGVLALIVFGLLLPGATGTPRSWPRIIGISFFLGLNAYLFRIGTRRFLPIYVATLSLAATVVYAFATFRLGGIPRYMPERMWWAFVVTLPLLGLVWAAWAWTHPVARD
jgi:hypothetical protein